MDNDLKQRLHSVQLRATAPRLAVLHVLDAADTPLRAQAIQEQMKTNADTATVYRILSTFVEAGIARQIDLSEQAKYFEPDCGDDHHHLVCTRCDHIEEVHGCAIGDLSKEILRGSSFASVDRHSLEFFGICKSCAS